MKYIYDETTVNKLLNASRSELSLIDCQRIKIMQEITKYGEPTSKPMLMMTDSNGKTMEISGYDNIVRIATSFLKLIESRKIENKREKVAEKISKYMSGVTITIDKDQHVITKKDGASVKITIKDTDLDALLDSENSGSIHLLRNLVNSINDVFLKARMPKDPELFFFNGVFWTRTAGKPNAFLTPDEILVMFENSIPGSWNATGIFEKREDIRTWISDQSLDQIMEAKKEVDTLVSPAKKSSIGHFIARPEPTIMGGMEFKDISDEEFRMYEFENGKTIKIVNPTKLNVSKSGGHRILNKEGFSHYVPAGWVHLWWKVKPGKSPFSF